MIDKFTFLLANFFSYLSDSNTNLDSLTWLVDSFRKYSPIYKEDDHKQTTFKGKCTVAEYISIFRCYCSFFNFKLLESAFVSIKYKEGQHLLSEYKKDFAKYAKYLVTHCPSGVGMKDVDCANVYVKLDDAYKGCKMEHLETLQEDLCEILNVEVHLFPLEGVEPGCVCVVFHLPLALKDEVFPLSLGQVSALKRLSYNEARVLRISCGDYSMEVNHEQGVYIYIYPLLQY